MNCTCRTSTKPPSSAVVRRVHLGDDAASETKGTPVDMAVALFVAVSFTKLLHKGSGPHTGANPGMQSHGATRNGGSRPAPGFPERP